MEFILLLLTGLVIGTIVIAMGGGGAAFYLGILTAMFGLKASVAASTSLVTAIPAVFVGFFGYWRANQINFHAGNQMLLVALPMVIIGSLIAPFIPNNIYTWIVAIILVILGFQLIFKKSREDIQSQTSWISRLYAVMAGLMVGIAGLSGGGPILVGLLFAGLPLFKATATSSYVIGIMCLVGAVVHTSSGQVDWAVGIPLMIGAIIGAFIAPQLVKILQKSPFRTSSAKGDWHFADRDGVKINYLICKGLRKNCAFLRLFPLS